MSRLRPASLLHRNYRAVLPLGETVQCEGCSVQFDVYNLQCAVRSIQCAVCSVQCALCSIQCAVRSIQCSVCSVHCLATSCRVCVEWHRAGLESLVPRFSSLPASPPADKDSHVTRSRDCRPSYCSYNVSPRHYRQRSLVFEFLRDYESIHVESRPILSTARSV